MNSSWFIAAGGKPFTWSKNHWRFRLLRFHDLSEFLFGIWIVRAVTMHMQQYFHSTMVLFVASYSSPVSVFCVGSSTIGKACSPSGGWKMSTAACWLSCSPAGFSLAAGSSTSGGGFAGSEGTSVSLERVSPPEVDQGMTFPQHQFFFLNNTTASDDVSRWWMPWNLFLTKLELDKQIYKTHSKQSRSCLLKQFTGIPELWLLSRNIFTHLSDHWLWTQSMARSPAARRQWRCHPDSDRLASRRCTTSLLTSQSPGAVSTPDQRGTSSGDSRLKGRQTWSLWWLRISLPMVSRAGVSFNFF